jgi:hypothetical protein
MAPLIQSFDVFDTLVARRSVEPRRVLDRLEARAGLPGLAAARLAADQRLGSRRKPHDLYAIWQEVQRAFGLDDATTRRLLDLEVQLEHDEVIPIVENLTQVRDGDLLVSDTYMPADIVRSLLRYAGLERTVGLVVTNDGKYRGWIWPQLLGQCAIRQHLGDNPHSDGRTPTTAGLRAVIYTGAHRSRIEQFLVEHDWPALANLVREVRLANPFTPCQPQERHLWLLACQLNFPLLWFASLALEHYVREQDVREVFFISRDGFLWHELYQQLFPHRQSTYLYASRLCLLKPSASYLEYFRATWHPQSVIVDLFSTGTSWAHLFARLETKARCFFLGHVDNYAYLPGGPRPQDWLVMHTIFRNSELGTPLNKGVEMLNYGSHATVEDVRWLPGKGALPVLAQCLEYDPSLPEAAHRSFRTCVEKLRHYPELLRSGPEGVPALIQAFVRFICADPHLPGIYAGHQAADAAYLQRLLA